MKEAGSDSSAGKVGGDGIPLLQHLFLLRASVTFNLHHLATPPAVAAAELASLCPKLSILSHFTCGRSSSASPLRPVAYTPEEESKFLQVNAPLKGLLSSLAAGSLAERVRLRRLQTSVVQAAVQLTGVAHAEIGAASSATHTSSSSGKERRPSCHAPSSLLGVLSAATADFAQDAALLSTILPPLHSKVNPWCLLPVGADGCYVVVPSPGYVRWCELQSARLCATAREDSTEQHQGNLTASAQELSTSGGVMRFSDYVHYASCISRGEPLGRSGGTTADAPDVVRAHACGSNLYGYAFVLKGDVFSGSDIAAASAAEAVSALNISQPPSEYRSGKVGEEEEEEESVLIWCVLGDAPVFNFMRSLTLEVVKRMSWVAQRVYRDQVAPTLTTAPRTAPSAAAYTPLLTAALQAEVLQPLATELLSIGSASSRTLPGDTFVLHLPPPREGNGDKGAPSAPLSLNFRRPLDLLFPYADVPLSTLVLSFNEDALRVLQSLLMQEERVVVIGATPQHASACVVSLLALLAPFTWVAPLIPYLPARLSAITGLLRSLLSAPFESQQHHQERAGRCAMTGSPPPPLPSSYGEPSGFLIGSTAAIVPYLMLLSSATTAFVSNRNGGCVGVARPPRLWIADARSGCIGVCPRDSVSRFSCLEYVAPEELERRYSSLADGSGANPWVVPSHVIVQEDALPQERQDGGSGGTGTGTAKNYTIDALQHRLRMSAELNGLHAAEIELLPAFGDELHRLLQSAASPERRRLFRSGLETMVEHTQARMERTASVATRLWRGLRSALPRPSTYAVSSARVAQVGCSSSSSDSEGDVRDGVGMVPAHVVDGDDGDSGNTSRGTITAALTQSFAQSFAAGVPVTAAAYSPASAELPSFPELSSAELWSVQVGLFDYVVSRLAGTYRTGLSPLADYAASPGIVRSRLCAPKLKASVCLGYGLDARQVLADSIARTHLFQQFARTVEAAETLGLTHVLCGGTLRGGDGQPGYTPSGSKAAGGESAREDGRHPLLFNVRGVFLFVLLCSRAALRFPELYSDVVSLDATGRTYAAMVARWFARGSAPSSTLRVPPSIQFMAGGSGIGGHTAGDVAASAYVVVPAAAHHHNKSSNGAGGGGVRHFLAKAAKAVKEGLSGGGGGGGIDGRVRLMRTAYIPAATTCLNSFHLPTSLTLSLSAGAPFFGGSFGGGGGQGGKRESLSASLPCHYHRHAGSVFSHSVQSKRSQENARQRVREQQAALHMEFRLVEDCSGLLKANATIAAGVAAHRADHDGNSNRFEAIYQANEIGSSEAVPTRHLRRGGLLPSRQQQQAMAEASLWICHALPLDVVHQFDAYEPLLAPACWSPMAANRPANTEDEGSVVCSVEAYMRVGMLCPSSVNMWCEGEARATRAIFAPPRADQRPPLPPPSLKTSERVLPPLTDTLGILSSSLSASPSAVAAVLAAKDPASVTWGAFTSGVPQGYTAAYPLPGPLIGDPLPPDVASLRGCASPTTPSVSSSGRPVGPSQVTSPHVAAWGTKGEAVHPSTKLDIPSSIASAETGAVVYRPSGVADAGGGGWSTGAPSSSFRGYSGASSSLTGPLPSFSPVSYRGGASPLSSTTSAAASTVPGTAVSPASRGVMDDLFADLPTISPPSASSTAAGRPAGAQPPPQTLDDFF